MQLDDPPVMRNDEDPQDTQYRCGKCGHRDDASHFRFRGVGPVTCPACHNVLTYGQFCAVTV